MNLEIISKNFLASEKLIPKSSLTQVIFPPTNFPGSQHRVKIKKWIFEGNYFRNIRIKNIWEKPSFFSNFPLIWLRENRKRTHIISKIWVLSKPPPPQNNPLKLRYSWQWQRVLFQFRLPFRFILTAKPFSEAVILPVFGNFLPNFEFSHRRFNFRQETDVAYRRYKRG